MTGEGPALTRVEVARLSSEGMEEQRESIHVDVLLTGAGRFPELIYVPRKAEEGGPGQGAILWATLTPYPSPFASEDIGIFRPGEATGDYKAVVEAIGAGRRAANSVHQFLTGNSVEAPARMIRKTTQVLTLRQIEPVTSSRRVAMPEISEERRLLEPNAEIATGYSREQAQEESKRCLQCGLICYRRMEGRQTLVQ
jgi:hypothetical protein